MKVISPILFAFFIAQLGFAESMSYREYLKQVLAREEGLTELVDRLENTSEKGSFLQGWRNPQIRGQYGEDDDTQTDLDSGFVTEENRTGYEVDVRVYPPNPFEVSSERNQTAAEYLELKSSVYEASRERFASIHEEWAEVLRALQLGEVYSGFAPFWEELRLLLKDTQSASSMSETDLLDWRMDLLEYMSTSRELERTLQRYSSALARRIGRLGSGVDPVAGNAEPQIELLEDEGDDLELVDVKRDLRNAQSDLQSARSEHWPWISHIQGSYGEVESDFDREGWSVQVAVDVPVFSWFSGDISRSKTAVLAAKTMLEEQQHKAMVVKEGLVQSYRANKEKVADFESNILPWLKELKNMLTNPDVQFQVSFQEQIKRVKTVLEGYDSYYELKLELAVEEAELVRAGLARLRL